MIRLFYQTLFYKKCFNYLALSTMASKATLPKYSDHRQFAERHLKLVELERQAEISEQKELISTMTPDQLEKAGICMRKMAMISHAVSLFGRTVCSFEPSTVKKVQMAKQGASYANVLSSGDIAGLCQGQGFGKVLMSGVVTKVDANGRVDIAFDSLETSQEEAEFDSDDMVDIIKLAPDITYRRLKSSLENLQKLDHSLTAVFYEQRPPALPNNDMFKLELDVDESLNASQKSAIVNALSQPEVAIIHGPPGTGKTTTLAEFLKTAVNKGQKILACAPSNVAVDNLAEKLLSKGIRNIVRLGHPARVLPHLQQCCLDAVISASDIMAVCDDIKQEISENSAKLLRSRDKGERWRIRGILRDLRKEFSGRQKRAVKEVIQGADVVLSTLTSIGNDDGVLARNAKQMQFDFVAIDECSQAIEAACWLALPLAPKCILAGDHLQLPPTVKASKEGLEVSLMERAISFLPPTTVSLLSIQYRMHEDIMNWSNGYLYDSKLTAHESVAKHCLQDLLGSSKDHLEPLIFVDTAGCAECSEIPAPNDLSHGNPGEAEIVGKQVAFLINDCNLEASSLGIISPYNHQVELIREQISKLLSPAKCSKIEVRSVDGFQGREKEVIVLSLVRSNNEGIVGFLGEVRRLNVAATRARRQLFVVGDSETLKSGQHLESFTEYLYSKAVIQSGSQYFDSVTFKPQSTKKSNEPAAKKVSDPPKNENLLKDDKIDNRSKPDELVKEQAENNRMSDEEDGGEEKLVKKSNRQLKRERKQRQAEEKVTAKEKQNQVRKATSSDKVKFNFQPQQEIDQNEMVVKPVPRAPILAAGIAKDLGAKAAHSATKQALGKVEDPDDIDAICEAMKELDSVCGFEICKKSVNVVAETCRYCKRKFCLAHAQPEIHGCGAEAKAHERRDFRSSFETSMRRENCLIPERVAKNSLDRSVLERRMEERLSKMKTDRSGLTGRKNKKK